MIQAATYQPRIFADRDKERTILAALKAGRTYLDIASDLCCSLERIRKVRVQGIIDGELQSSRGSRDWAFSSSKRMRQQRGTYNGRRREVECDECGKMIVSHKAQGPATCRQCIEDLSDADARRCIQEHALRVAAERGVRYWLDEIDAAAVGELVIAGGDE